MTEQPKPSKNPFNNLSRKSLIIAGSVAAALLFLCCGTCTFIGVFGNKMSRAMAAELAQGDALWDKGDKVGGAAKYRNIIDNHDARFIDAADCPRLYGRVIDFEFENGRADTGKAYMDKAEKKGVTPMLSHAEANAMVAAIQAEKTRGDVDKAEKKRLAEAKKNVEMLTADFYPHKKGAIYHTFSTGKFGNSGVEIDTKREYVHLDGGVIEKRTLQATIIRPARKELPGGPPVKLLRREKNGFLEIGKNEEVLKDVIFWSPLIKIGAVAGDEWEGGSAQYPNREDAGEPKAHFKLVRFTQEPILPSLVPSGKMFCATIEETFSAAGITAITEHVLGKDIGPVRTTGWEVKNGVRKETYRDALVPPPKK